MGLRGTTELSSASEIVRSVAGEIVTVFALSTGSQYDLLLQRVRLDVVLKVALQLRSHLEELMEGLPGQT